MRAVECFEASPPPSRAAITCGVCGSHDVWVDEVLERGVLALAECARCDYRWTWHPQRVVAVGQPASEVRRVA